MRERTGAELGAILNVLDFRCEECDAKVLPGARLCIDCRQPFITDTVKKRDTFARIMFA